MSIRKKLIGVQDDSQSKRYQVLLRALGRLFPVEFRQALSQDRQALDGLLVLNGDVAAGLAAAAKGVPSFVVTGEDRAAHLGAESEVRFGGSPYLDEYLRNQVMLDGDVGQLRPLSLQAGDEVLASKEGQPVWLCRPGGRAVCHWVGISPPPLQEGDFIFQHLSGRRFMELLPLLNFLRQVVKDVDWCSPAPRACFVFDDPSLYWRSYGFLDYRCLAANAAEHNYFVSVATVPLDTWWVNRAVANTFRSNSPRLSLLIHGNNHTSHELLAPHNGANPLALPAQAMRRMERLTCKHQLAFARIMEAPHGVVADSMFQDLLTLGYEAALCTTEWLVRYNPHTSWPATIGMDKTQFLGGLPVLPRIRMSPHWKNDVLLAAFLRQPILVVGHHWDAVGQLAAMADIAKVINSLKGVRWSPPAEIARSNYKELRRGDSLDLKIYSRRVRFSVPYGVKNIFVHRPWLQSDGPEEMLIVNGSDRQLFHAPGPAVVGPIQARDRDLLEIFSPQANPVDPRIVEAPKPRCWPVLRKGLMEVRDRSAPWRYRTGRLLLRAIDGVDASRDGCGCA